MIDATDKIVMPGLVNAHMHTWETALRGIGAEWMSADYLRHIHANLATRYTAEDNYLGNLIGALAQIDAGVTTLVDWCHNITSLEMAERAVDGLVDSGIRAVFAHGTAKPPTRQGGTPFTHMPHPRDRIEALRKGRLASDDGRVTLAMAILGPDWGAWEVVEHDIRMAREFGLVSSSHTRRREDCVVPDGYARMAKAGLLGPDHNLVHGTSYDHADLRSSSTRGASLTSTVLVELHHHVGDTRSRPSARPAACPRSASTSSHSAPARCSARCRRRCCSRAARKSATTRCAATRRYKMMPVRSREALEWATVGGARAFLMEDKIGTLSPGKKADIVMLRANDINMAPVYDPVYSIVEIAGAGNVDTVIIDGIVRKQNGKLTFPADVLRKRLEELAESGARIMREGGLQGGDRAGMSMRKDARTIGENHMHRSPAARRSPEFRPSPQLRRSPKQRPHHHDDARLHARRQRRHRRAPHRRATRQASQPDHCRRAASWRRRHHGSGCGRPFGAGRHDNHSPAGRTCGLRRDLQPAPLQLGSGLHFHQHVDGLSVHPCDVSGSSCQQYRRCDQGAQAEEGKLTCATAGNGTGMHLALELFMAMGKANIQHVPYRGSPQAITDLLAKRIDFQMDTPAALMPLLARRQAARHRGHGTRALLHAARCTGDRRQRLHDYAVTSWLGIAGPAGLPAPFVNKVNAEVRAILADPAVVERLRALGSEARPTTPEGSRPASPTMSRSGPRWSPTQRFRGFNRDAGRVARPG